MRRGIFGVTSRQHAALGVRQRRGHLEALQAGKTFDVRFAVLDRLETIGFTLKATDFDARVEYRFVAEAYR